AWGDYAAQSFRPSLARKFFGFGHEGLQISKISGIASIGAHPMASVISGAMLYMSDGAILDLPPFSNFGLNVSWIDDHLKYCLHRELRHLSPLKQRAAEREKRTDPLLTYSKLDRVIVEKAGRKIEENFPKYIFDIYLPTLLRGTIMDAWITPDPLLKYRPEELSPEDCAVLDKISREGRSNAVLPSALRNALEKCDLVRAEWIALENDLTRIALERINEVRRQWMNLTEDGSETFASVWAKGEAKSRFPNLDLKYRGIPDPSKVHGMKEISDPTFLDQPLMGDLDKLVKDALDYIKWTLKWPTIVQVVRSIEQGTLRTDLNFDPEREDRA
ncbi:MAG: hypothetical protein WAM70_13015, partial [Pyrinomonadaceae bacterium]